MPPDLLTSPSLLATLAQLGAAGLIGWMWLTERRAAAVRERQLSEAHERITAERQRVETLVGLVTESTRALAALEASQRDLARVVERLAAVLGERPAPVAPRPAV